MNCPEADRLSFEDRLGLLVDRQITGPTGVGKIYLACALAHTACVPP